MNVLAPSKDSAEVVLLGAMWAVFAIGPLQPRSLRVSPVIRSALLDSLASDPPTAYALAATEQPERLAEYGGAVDGIGRRLTEIVVAYGEHPEPWARVGTQWLSDERYGETSGRRVELIREGMTDRLALHAAEIPEGEAYTDPDMVKRRLRSAHDAVGAWKQAVLVVDGAELHGWTASVREHRLTYAFVDDHRVAYVQTHSWSGATGLRSGPLTAGVPD